MANNYKLASSFASLPLVCTLTPIELGQREQTVAKILAKAVERQELPNGYAFRFESEASTVSEIVEFVLGERECCQFFRFELVFEPGLGPLWLQISGDDGAAVKQLLDN